jgi:hypothetical protein
VGGRGPRSRHSLVIAKKNRSVLEAYSRPTPPLTPSMPPQNKKPKKLSKKFQIYETKTAANQIITNQNPI